MLQNIRDNVQGTMAKIIIGIIIVPFAAFGIESLFSSSGPKEAATINGQEITEFQVQQAIQLRKRQILSRMGENADFSQLDDAVLRKPAMESLIQRKVLLQQAEKMGFDISDKQLDQIILQVPDFQEGGQYSPALFESLIRSSGMTPKYYKNLLREELMVSQLSSPMTQGGFVTEKQIDLTSRFTEQKRDLRYLTIPMEQVLKDVELVEEEIQQYYEENASRFYSQEKVVVDYLEIKRSDFYEPVDEEDIREQYDQKLAQAQTDLTEKRRASHILVELSGDMDEEKAREKLLNIKTQLAEGTDFSELAKANSDDAGSKNSGGDLGFSNGETFPKPFEDALAQLAVDQVSDAVKTDAGLHLIKLTEIQKNEPASFEESRKRIELDIQRTAAEGVYVEKVEQLADLTFNADNLIEPAVELGVKVKTSESFTRSGGSGLFENQKLVTTAFSKEILKENSNSEVVELSDDHAVVLRMKKHFPSELQSLDSVRELVETGLRKQKAQALLAEKAQSFLTELQKGAIIQEVANQNKLVWQVTSSATRNSGGVDRKIIEKAFSMPAPGENQQCLDTVNLDNGDVVIISVANVRTGSSQDLLDEQRKMMKNYLGRNEGFGAMDAYQKAYQKKAEVKVL